MIFKLFIKYLIFVFFIINVYSIKVSVIIHVYNDEKYLESTLSSVINQTLNDIEIICIDDASNDNSLEILRNFEEKDNRVTVIHFDESKGKSVARNKGIELAKGEFLSFMDSDYDVDENYLELLYSYSTDYDIIVSKFARRINFSKADFVNKPSHYNPKHGFLVDSIFRKEFIDKNDIKFPEDKKIAEDIIFRKTCYKNNPRIFKIPYKGILKNFEDGKDSWKKSNRRIEKLRKRVEREAKRRNKRIAKEE